MNSYRIPEGNLPELHARIGALGKKATKLGLRPPTIVVDNYEDEPLVRRKGEYDARPRTWPPNKAVPFDLEVVGYRRYYIVHLEGEAPSVPGWELVAVVEHGDSEVGNVVRVVPGRAVPAHYRQAQAGCAHCGLLRKRSETFVLTNAEGVCKQIGRNCLGDYLRDPAAAEQMVSAAECLSRAGELCGLAEDEGWGRAGGTSPARLCTHAVLAMTARIIRHLGWVSRAKAREHDILPTSQIVRAIFTNPKFFQPTKWDTDVDRKLREAAKDIQKEDEALAESSLDWARSLRNLGDTLDDYQHNLVVVLSGDSLEERHLGIACSAIASYQRTLRVAEEQKRTESERKKSRHVGEVGKRSIFNVEVVNLRHFDSEFGVRILCRMKDEEGNTLVWWTGEGCPFKEGEKYRVKGTVKSHDDYKSWPQTVLSRVVEYVEPVKPPRKRKKACDTTSNMSSNSSTPNIAMSSI